MTEHRRGFGEEDISFLFDGVGSDPGLETLSVASMRVSDLLTAPDLAQSLQMVVQLIYFNTARPDNMTVHVREDSEHGHVWVVRGDGDGDGNGNAASDGRWERRLLYDIANDVMCRAAKAMLSLECDPIVVQHFRRDLYVDVVDYLSIVRRMETVETLVEGTRRTRHLSGIGIPPNRLV